MLRQAQTETSSAFRLTTKDVIKGKNFERNVKPEPHDIVVVP